MGGWAVGARVGGHWRMKHIVIIGRMEQEWAADLRIQKTRARSAIPAEPRRGSLGQGDLRRRQSRAADANVHRRRVKGLVSEPAARFFICTGLQWSEKQRNLISSPERFTFSPLFTAFFLALQ